MKVSVVYITNGRRTEILNKCLRSAAFANEIIVVGAVDDVHHSDVVKIQANNLANNGMISKMRNIGAAAATGDIIINADDDIFFPYAFRKKLLQFVTRHPDISVFNTKIIGINGSRYWDRATHDNAAGTSCMIDYTQSHQDLYYTGAFLIRHRLFAIEHRWDNNLKYYQKEDVEYSNRIKQAGYPVTIDANNYVVHLDVNYVSYRDGNNKLVCNKINVPIDDLQEKEFREISAYKTQFDL
jgi:GT2 family glycosyltransferase